MEEPKTARDAADRKAPETQKDVFRGAQRREDHVPSDAEDVPRDHDESQGQRTEAPGAGFPDPDLA